jgi:hypothetical protein
MKKIKEWTKQHPYLFTFIGGIIVFMLLHFGLHAEERTAGDYAKDATIDALGAAAAFAASAEQAATGNFFTGTCLFSIGAFEAEKAWNEANQAWDCSGNAGRTENGD